MPDVLHTRRSNLELSEECGFFCMAAKSPPPTMQAAPQGAVEANKSGATLIFLCSQVAGNGGLGLS